jgi:hypothetical protein
MRVRDRDQLSAFASRDGKQRWIELRIPRAETRVVLFTRRVMRIASARSSTARSLAIACGRREVLKARGVEFVQVPET